jgi:hypothetical protein
VAHRCPRTLATATNNMSLGRSRMRVAPLRAECVVTLSVSIVHCQRSHRWAAIRSEDLAPRTSSAQKPERFLST